MNLTDDENQQFAQIRSKIDRLLAGGAAGNVARPNFPSASANVWRALKKHYEDEGRYVEDSGVLFSVRDSP